MKRFTAISLALLMLAASMKDMVVWAGFKINQDFIARELCINRNKPRLHCNGKCFLAKKLAESQEKDASKAPLPQPADPKQIFYLHPQINVLPDEWIAISREADFGEATFSPQSVFPDIFQPPKA